MIKQKMTKQEAIPILESAKQLKTILPQTKEALDIAVESLKLDSFVTESQDQRNKKDRMLKVLFNRCRVTAALCIWCGMRKECDEYSSLDKGE